MYATSRPRSGPLVAFARPESKDLFQQGFAAIKCLHFMADMPVENCRRRGIIYPRGDPFEEYAFYYESLRRNKKANRHFIRIVELFNRAGYRVTAHVTQAPGDAVAVARELASEVDAVVCCGGDGTFNETLSGVMASGAKTPIGYIPAGSTNDFAASLKLPTGILSAARNVADGHPVYYDIGLFNDRYFSYVASFGAFTRVSYTTSQSIKNALGHTAYLLSGISELSQLRKIHAKLELDGEVIEDDYLFGAVCNSTSVAGLLTLDKSVVDLQDGKFEILLVRAPKHISEINECIKAIQNKTYDCKMMTFRSAAEVTVTMDEPVDWTLDGEFQPGFPRVHLRNRHLALALLTKKE